jgi:hypothetical protein
MIVGKKRQNVVSIDNNRALKIASGYSIPTSFADHNLTRLRLLTARAEAMQIMLLDLRSLVWRPDGSFVVPGRSHKASSKLLKQQH